ncbi:MAG TPA: BTAD domain-containing putative transcriptional regulator [Candidatus Limnocylindria bacterium]|nr:BTAD domain-containing putative transcriptional regulator [Candidatus Limnocylindria bacterium]
MDFRILGPLEVTDDGRPIELGGPKQRAVLGHLLLRAGQLVTVEQLIDDVWGADPPEAVRASLQASISRLRRVLGTARIEGRPAGYVFNVADRELDALRFEALVRQARRLIGTDPRESAELFRRALLLWLGSPLAGTSGGPQLAAAVAALDELRLAAVEEHVALELALGNEAGVVAELETRLAENPLRERLWSQLMIALYRTRRQAEALEAYHKARRMLRDELGLDPSAELEQLQLRILQHDPQLDVRSVPLRGYQLLERIGEGTFGVVHRAIQPGVGRQVALKAIRPSLAHQTEFIRRFEAEAQLVARLEHPHIVPLYDFWRDADGAYLVMRWIKGGSLASRLRGPPLAVEHAVALLGQVSSALAAAHAAGVVHRDVKPANILLDEQGNAYLSDFGIARELAAGGSGDTAADSARYLSPEEVRGEPATTRSDVFALGGLMYEMLVARRPYTGSPVEPLVPPSSLRPELRSRFDGLAARALALDPQNRFPDARAFAQALEGLSDGGPATAVLDAGRAGTPYKGLLPFMEADADDFFGREALVAELLTWLREARHGGLLAIVGASGSGKSSVVRAGLLAALRRGAIDGSERWLISTMTPGSAPMDELAEAVLRVAPEPPAGLRRLLGRDPGALVELAEASVPAGSRLLLVVDQLEEVFTLATSAAERSDFLAALAQAATSAGSSIFVVVTLRADFYDRPLAQHDFAALLRAGTALLIPLSAEELERAIAAPARLHGVTVEPALVARLLADVANQPAALPLLQYALTEAFARRRGPRLTLDDYRAIGGISGAMAGRADALFMSLKASGREAVRQLFLRLVALDEDELATRRRVRRGELESLGLEAATLEHALRLYGEHRLLSFDRDPRTREPTIELAHEALLAEWPRLRAWIDAARDDVRAERRLAAAAAEWVAAQRDASFLVRGAQLARAEAWMADGRLALTGVEQEYLSASRAEREAAEAAAVARRDRERALERRAVSRLRALLTVFAFGTIVAGGLAAFAFGEQARAEQEARRATARELAGAALANLGADPDLAIHLALGAVELTRERDGVVLREAEEALHSAVLASRVIERQAHDSSRVWTSDGRYVGLSDSGALVIRDAASEQILASLPTELPGRLGVSPGGRHVATGALDAPPTLWDAADGSPIRTMPGTTVLLDALAFNPDGSLLAATSIDGAARVWEVPSGREVAAITTAGADAPSGRGLTVAWHPHSAVLAVAGGTETVLHDVSSGEHHVLPGDGRAAVFSPQGDLLLTAGLDSASLWRIGPLLDGVTEGSTGESAQRLAGHLGFVDAAAFSSDGRLAATGAQDGFARVWDVASGELRLALPGLASIASLQFEDEGSGLRASGPTGSLGWDIGPAGSREVLTFAAHGALAYNVAYDPSGSRLVTAGSDRGARIWQASDGRLLHELGGDAPVGDAVFSPDGSLLATASFDGTAALWQTASGTLLRRLEGHAAPLWGVAFSPDGSRLLTAGEDATARVWDVASGSQLALFDDHTAFVYDAAWQPQGSLVVSVGNDFVARLWHPATGQQERVLRGHADNVLEQAFSPDGTELATASFDRTAIVWDVASGEVLHTLDGHGGIVLDVEASPDGTRWATASLDGTVRLWERASGRELLVIRLTPQPPGRLAFDPTGRRLAAATNDGLVRVLALDVNELVSIARQRVSRPLSEFECRQYLRVERCPEPG